MNFVLDASIALSWCFEDEKDEYAVSVLEELRTSEAVAASLWPYEVANGLITAEQKKRIALADAQRFIGLLLSLPIVIDPLARRRAFDNVLPLARKHSLTSYDAAYLELATRMSLPDRNIGQVAANRGES